MIDVLFKAIVGSDASPPRQAHDELRSEFVVATSSRDSANIELSSALPPSKIRELSKSRVVSQEKCFARKPGDLNVKCRDLTLSS